MYSLQNQCKHSRFSISLPADEQDVEKDLRNCRAVLVDVSAPPHLIGTFMTYFDPTGDVCLVVAATQVCLTYVSLTLSCLFPSLSHLFLPGWLK